MQGYILYDLKQFLIHYPRMSVRPTKDSSLVIQGFFDFTAQSVGKPEITDSYQLRIIVPSMFPREIPKVVELGNKIPRDGKYHVNLSPYDSLCLGSPIRLMLLIRKKPSIIGFAENCIVPYLYAVSNKLQHGGDFVFGELNHGSLGIIEDYKHIFGLKSKWQVIQMLKLLSIERRYANKMTCPCGCRKKLKQCRFHKTLNSYRKIAPIAWFRIHTHYIISEL